MKERLTSTALCLMLALGLAAPGSFAFQMSRPAEAPKRCGDAYKAAVKKADDDYKMAVKGARAKKGKDRADAMNAASKARTDAWSKATKDKAVCLKAAVACEPGICPMHGTCKRKCKKTPCICALK